MGDVKDLDRTELWTPGSGLVLVEEGERSEQVAPDTPRAEVAAPLASDDVIISGGGWSHGVGMSQYGAYALALARDDRYATSAKVSEWGYPTGTERAFLATGTDFPDALAGSAIAGAVSGPVLLVKQATVPGPVEAELRRLGVNEVSLLGGPAAISYTVQDTVDGL